MSKGDLGTLFKDGEVIIRQGEVGNSMYVIQEGQVEILREKDGREVRLRTLGSGEIVGEMAIIDRQARSATVRALGEVRVLTVDKRTFLQRISEDPSVALRMLQDLSGRIRELSAELARLKEQS
jgi:CRP-like cAMP-binding protein